MPNPALKWYGRIRARPTKVLWIDLVSNLRYVLTTTIEVIYVLHS